MTLPNRIDYLVAENNPGMATMPVPQPLEQPAHSSGNVALLSSTNSQVTVISDFFFSGRQHPFPTISEEESARKNFVHAHKLTPVFREFVTISAKEGLYPSIFYFPPAEFEPADPNLEEFLAAQGLDHYNSEDEFCNRLEQLTTQYYDEIDKLDKVCSEFSTQVFNILKEQSNVRFISHNEVQQRIQAVQQKFEVLRSMLKHCVCNGITKLAKEFKIKPKKKRCLPKKASDELAQWLLTILMIRTRPKKRKVCLQVSAA